MKKIYILISVIIVLVFIGSCNDDFAYNDNKEIIDNLSGCNIPYTDSLEIKYIMQSNPELILSDRIIYKNSTFILDLSLEEATELMIPIEIYNETLNKITMLNEKSIY